MTQNNQQSTSSAETPVEQTEAAKTKETPEKVRSPYFEEVTNLVTKLCADKRFTPELRQDIIKKATAFLEKNSGERSKSVVISTIYRMLKAQDPSFSQRKCSNLLGCFGNVYFGLSRRIGEHFNMPELKRGTIGYQDSSFKTVSENDLVAIVSKACGKSKEITKEIQDSAVDRLKKLLKSYQTGNNFPTDKRMSVDTAAQATLYITACEGQGALSLLSPRKFATETSIKTHYRFAEYVKLLKEFYKTSTKDISGGRHKRVIKYHTLADIFKVMGYTSEEKKAHQLQLNLTKEIYNRTGFTGRGQASAVSQAIRHARKHLTENLSAQINTFELEQIAPYLPPEAHKTVTAYLKEQGITLPEQSKKAATPPEGVENIVIKAADVRLLFETMGLDVRRDAMAYKRGAVILTYTYMQQGIPKGRAQVKAGSMMGYLKHRDPRATGDLNKFSALLPDEYRQKLVQKTSAEILPASPVAAEISSDAAAIIPQMLQADRNTLEALLKKDPDLTDPAVAYAISMLGSRIASIGDYYKQAGSSDTNPRGKKPKAYIKAK